MQNNQKIFTRRFFINLKNEHYWLKNPRTRCFKTPSPLLFNLDDTINSSKKLENSATGSGKRTPDKCKNGQRVFHRPFTSRVQSYLFTYFNLC